MNQLPAHETVKRFLDHANLVTERLLIPAVAVIGILAISASSGQLSEEVRLLAQYYGSAALSVVLAKINQGKSVTAEEVRDAVDQTFAEHHFEELLKKPEFSQELLQRVTELGGTVGTALQLTENTIVSRVLSGMGLYQEKWSRQLLDAILKELDHETQYLVKCVSLWERKQDGILERYVERDFKAKFPDAPPSLVQHEKTRLRHQALSKITVKLSKSDVSERQPQEPQHVDIREAMASYPRRIIAR